MTCMTHPFSQFLISGAALVLAAFAVRASQGPHPDRSRFFLGGSSTVRGFDYQLCPDRFLLGGESTLRGFETTGNKPLGR